MVIKCIIGLLKNLAKFSKKHLRWSLFLIKLKLSEFQIVKKDTSAQVISC